ncbi:MAG TPA: mechanosensitive ion channel [Flavobacteriales bacterium]|jgi:small conductance mechanosensitive channel|nr:mechanosensitive ion channel [Flavobacteriales bacterium]HQW98433.1 mechanosensitive ion channel [Flavobacteriales bacterium]HQX99426.1 mechanosensitive ion channel [Flavobacteriales bacterium]
MNNTSMDSTTRIAEQAWHLLLTYGPRVLLALAVLLLGLWVIGLFGRGMGRLMKKREVDPSLIPFLQGLVTALLKVMLVLSVVGMVGVETTSFIAVLGAAGLAVGLALSGTLQNFAGGVMILLFKPFKVGDFIEAQGHSGTVRSIHIFNTILKTPDNKTVVLPNAPVSSGAMVNYSTEAKRRVDLTFGIGYGDDIDKARGVLEAIIAADKRVLNDPAPFTAVGELADSSVNFVVRLWVESGDYWGVHFNTIEQVKKRFDAEGISIPFPQMDIHRT